MHSRKIEYYLHLYKDALLDDVIPFWERHSPDVVNGGYFTCLDRKGQVYDQDKFIWLQGRQAWMFATLFNKIDQKEDWLSISKSGIDFLVNKGKDSHGNFYFATTSDGKPLVKPYNIFSDCFAAMALAQYAVATNDDEIKGLAKSTYENILSRKDHPKGPFEKNTETRPLKGFSLPMILSNLVLELEDILSFSEINDTISTSVEEVMNIFLDPSSGLVYEYVLPDGSQHNSFNGRLLNPGHGIEAMWFMMNIGDRNRDQELINRAADTTLTILEYAWDPEYDGIFYFMDAKGHPPQQLEWDQKLWWVHLEALIALLKGYLLTDRTELWLWFEKVHDYTWTHFPDPKFGEWFGYLNRQGHPVLDLKGGKWKGCFHLPRALMVCWQMLEELKAVEGQKSSKR